MDLKELAQRYEAAMHGMQAGVALDVAMGAPDCTTKHLRVGVNSALIDSGALALALIRKGLLTEEEHMTALVEVAEAERASYEERHSSPSVKVKLV